MVRIFVLMSTIFSFSSIGFAGETLSSNELNSFKCTASGTVCANDCRVSAPIDTSAIIKAPSAAVAVSSHFSTVVYAHYSATTASIDTSNIEVNCTEMDE